MTTAAPGIYGKLPTHGDFIQRNLSAAFVAPWDAWLQHYVAASKERIGEEWLDIYLTSPIWRFALSPGVVDEHGWAGIMMPSVDLVGRYFPFTVALRLAPNETPTAFLAQQVNWLAQVETAALTALENDVALDDLTAELGEFERLAVAAVKLRDTRDNGPLHLDVEQEALAQTGYALMCDALLKDKHRGYSVWSTAGSARVAPCMFSTPSLPAINKLPAMLDGQWLEWGWELPCAAGVVHA